MIRSRRLIKSTHQPKEEQISFKLEDIEKIFKKYRKAIVIRDNQIVEMKKILQIAKKSHDSENKENRARKSTT